MRNGFTSVALIISLILIFILPSQGASDMGSFQEGQAVHGFKAMNLYENSAGSIMGTRFISEKYGFIIDLMQIESVPQAFYWIKTVPTSSKGEPHACEHLLLGKGNRGRYVATLEDMSLGNSTAYTSQLRTCYHFNTTSGMETFYEIFEAKLDAFLHPDFADEEIRREVCHIGVTENPETHALEIEEKGTVYTEMVSAYEKPWYYSYNAMNTMVYGSDHPLTLSSGGNPDVMRDMVPADMWKFHKECYHLANMGCIVAIPDGVEVEDFLGRLEAMLNRLEAEPDHSDNTGIGAYVLPEPRNAEPGSMKLVTYPSNNAEDPAYMMFAWPAELKMTHRDQFVLGLFLDAFASGQTSNLYKLFIDSETKKTDLGGQNVYGGADDDCDVSIYFGLNGVDRKHAHEAMLDSVRALIVGELARVHDFADGSEELAEFNKRIANRLAEQRKYYDDYLNSPPMFGFRRGSAGGWLSLLEDVEKEPGFRKSLIMKERLAYADSLLALKENVWRNRIDSWRLLTVPAYAIASSPDPDMLTKAAAAKERRLAGYIAGFEQSFGVDDEQAAIAHYKETFDAKTAELEALAGDDKMPGFTDNPPMTLDDQLKYEVTTLPGNIPYVVSTFDNVTSSTFGLCFKLDVIPESLLVYVPFLSDVLESLGVVKDGETVSYDEMTERQRREILSLSAGLDWSLNSGRTELTLTGRGSNLAELKNAIGWMDAAMYSPLLTVDNLSRIRDVVDQSLMSYRNRMKRSEEAWVDNPPAGYRGQRNPLMMTASCFLTQMHHVQRLKWLLADAGDDAAQKEIFTFVDQLVQATRGLDRDATTALLVELESFDSEAANADQPLVAAMRGFSELSQDNAREIVSELKATMVDIPDATLAADLAYLADEIKRDLVVKPETTLAQLKNTLDLLLHVDNARAVMVSNEGDRLATAGLIEALVGKLDAVNPSVRQTYAEKDYILDRLRQREPEAKNPVYVGLVYEGTRNGVLVFTAKKAESYDTTTGAVLDYLAGNLYGGGGPHGLFMKTWAAGLAYSNGYSASASSGIVRYYAERCPDIAETMGFVVGQLEQATDDPTLTDYAVAQTFGYSRAPSRYESRGISMARDLADGLTPEHVSRFRQKALELRNRPGLYEELKSRMPQAYGPVLIGYGQPLAESRDGSFFIIGPETQFETLENYIAREETPQKVHRLYPRDWWLAL